MASDTWKLLLLRLRNHLPQMLGRIRRWGWRSPRWMTRSGARRSGSPSVPRCASPTASTPRPRPSPWLTWGGVASAGVVPTGGPRIRAERVGGLGWHGVTEAFGLEGGQVAPGQPADLVSSSRPLGMWLAGVQVPLTSRQGSLLEKYRSRLK
jgi:hypothetical protein